MSEPLTATAASTTNNPDNGVGATSFLLGLIARENAGLALGADGFYFENGTSAGADALIVALDAIFTGGYFINDFQYGAVLAFLVEDQAPPDGKLRLGGNLAAFDTSRDEAYEKAIISDDREAYYEFFSGAPVPSGRDEMLGVLWRFGIRCGIDTASLENTLTEGARKPGKYLVARSIPMVEGCDAKPVPLLSFQRQRTIKETDVVGHADMHFYECGFPQTPNGPGPHPLLEKLPAVPGRAGRTVSGKRIEAQPAKDFDLARMAGAGTRVADHGGKPMIVTDHGGFFIDVDAKQTISVSAHAKNSFPIGPKTGSFEVRGEFFEQCGDIEHQYLLIGRNIEIRPGSVFGRVVSHSGHVVVAGKIESGGQVEAEGGNVTVESAVLGGRIVALAGKITVKQAEGSVLIAREVEVAESAVNCFIIADTIRIKKAVGIALYAQNVAIGELDLNEANANPVAGYIALRDNQNARKAIRRFEKRQRRLDKVDQIETLVREQGLTAAWEALDARLSNGEQLSPDEARGFGPLLKPYEYVRRRKAMVTKDRAFFADPKYMEQYQAAELAVTKFEASLQASVGLSIETITYPPELAASIRSASANDPAAALNAAPQSWFAYISSDPPIGDLPRYDKKLQRHFLAFVSRMLAGTVLNEARIRPLYSLALLQAPCRLDYAQIKAFANADNSASSKERRSDGARIEIRSNVVIPVLVDGYSIGRLRNVSDQGASIMFDDTQDNPPVFENLEEVNLAIQPGYLVTNGVQQPLSAWEEQQWPFSIAAVIENDSAGLVKIGGFYAHMNEEALNRSRRLRMQIEALMLKLGHEPSQQG
jgi:hypothetical protein